MKRVVIPELRDRRPFQISMMKFCEGSAPVATVVCSLIPNYLGTSRVLHGGRLVGSRVGAWPPQRRSHPSLTPVSGRTAQRPNSFVKYYHTFSQQWSEVE